MFVFNSHILTGNVNIANFAYAIRLAIPDNINIMSDMRAYMDPNPYNPETG